MRSCHLLRPPRHLLTAAGDRRNSSGRFDLRLRGRPGGSFVLRFAVSTSTWPPLTVDPVLSGAITMAKCPCVSTTTSQTRLPSRAP